MTTEPGPLASSRLLFATTNAGKLREARALLAPLGVMLLSPADLGLTGEIVEDGADYAANARLKAVHGAARSDLVAIGEDSGIEIDALAGAPGLHSARFGGPGVDDRGRNALVLERLAEVPAALRGARFVAVQVVARPDGRELLVARGECRGRIAAAPRGTLGFGYDPIFEDEEGRGLTFGEIGPEAKMKRSHRARAFRRLAAALPAALAATAGEREPRAG